MERVSSNLLSSGQALGIFLQSLFYAGLVAVNLYVITLLLGEPFSLPYRVFAALSFVLGFLAFRRVDLFNAWRIGEIPYLSARLTLSWFLLVASLFFIAYLAKLSVGISRPIIFWWTLSTPLLLLLAHALVRIIGASVFSKFMRRRRAVLVFVSEASRQLMESVEKDRYSRFELIGYYEDRDLGRTGPVPGLPYLGKSDEVAEDIKKRNVDAVFVVLPEVGIARAKNVIDDLDETPASIFYVPDLFVLDLTKARVSEFNGIPILELYEAQFWGVDGALKRTFDVVVASLILLVIAPLMAMIAVIVKLQDGGPVFFTQTRCGINSVPFLAYKFRSMRVAPVQAGFEPHATVDDPRVTWFGGFLRRTSLDELPQFFNVLKGDMSIVGPRPHALSHDEHYRKAVRRYVGRHKVPPGITGWAQVKGLRGEIRNHEDMQKRIEHDLYYIRNWTPALDLKIVFMTVPRMLHDPKAY